MALEDQPEECADCGEPSDGELSDGTLLCFDCLAVRWEGHLCPDIEVEVETEGSAMKRTPTTLLRAALLGDAKAQVEMATLQAQLTVQSSRGDGQIVLGGITKGLDDVGPV